MIYPDNFEQKIGIDTIRQYVTEKCLGTMGEERVKAMSFSSDFTVVLHRLEQTAEFLRIVKDKEDFPAENFIDMCPCLRRVQQDKTVWLNEQEIWDSAIRSARSKTSSASSGRQRKRGIPDTRSCRQWQRR